jgi:hypothetical protein
MTKEFKQCSKETQKEIIELFSKDKYISNAKKDKSRFENLSEATQKEIAELSLNEKYNDVDKAVIELKQELVFENKFDGNRILKIREFEAEQERKRRDFMEQMSMDEQQKTAREFTSAEQVKQSLGIKQAEGEISGIVLKETQHAEFKGAEKDLIKQIKDNEQKYMNSQVEKEIKLLKSISNLGYAVKLYE